MAAKRPAITTVYQLKVTLKGSKPPIWRRIQVPGDVTLYKLHKVLQVAMGWTDSHLHQFIAHGRYYGEPDPDFADMDVVNERRVKLSQVADREKAKFIYEYDFGDDWLHEILVEKILGRRQAQAILLALRASAVRPPKIAAVSGGTKSFWGPSAIPSTQSTRRCSNGWAASSTRKPSIWRQSTESCGNCPDIV